MKFGVECPATPRIRPFQQWALLSQYSTPKYWKTWLKRLGLKSSQVWKTGVENFRVEMSCNLGGALLLPGSDKAQTESLNLRGDLWPNRKPYSSMIVWWYSDWNSTDDWLGISLKQVFSIFSCLFLKPNIFFFQFDFFQYF